MRDSVFIRQCMDKVMAGGTITFEEADKLLAASDIITLAESANAITRKFNGDRVDVEVLINAKSGNCPEDCSFCAQSSFSSTPIAKYRLLPDDVILEQAQKAKDNGASSFCLVCAYRSPPEEDFDRICKIVSKIKKKLGIDVNVSLGFMTPERARKLREIGVRRYNHNLETSESYFSQICKTHDFADRVKTARIVKEAGLELCCGGIIGMGETPKQRLELAFSLASLKPDEVPLNILIPRDGTPMQGFSPLDILEIVKTIAVWRFIMPGVILKIAGGREACLKDDDRLALKAGANGIITGGYLTTSGNEPSKDISMIEEIGLHT